MNIILIYIGVSLFFVNNAFCNEKKIIVTEADQANLIAFLNSNAEENNKFPLNLTKDQIQRYSFMSGQHDILPNDNESMFSIRAHNVKANKIFFYKFTVSPSIPYSEVIEKEFNWKSLLSGRTVTQFVCIEKNTEKGITLTNIVSKIREQNK